MPHRKAPADLSSPAISATELRERVLAPDLARGAMLLLIALANVPLYLYGDGYYGYGMWVHGLPILDQVVVLLQTTLVNGRAYPMFALLFGYGIVQLQRRQTRGGVDELIVDNSSAGEAGGWCFSGSSMPCCCSPGTSSVPTGCLRCR